MKKTLALALLTLLSACKPIQERNTGSVSAAPTVYMGRTIAQPMSYSGADWLDRSDREAREQPEHVLDVLGLRPGMVVADVGAGTGYFSIRIVRRVAPGGRVLATDLQQQMLDMLREKAGPNPLIETIRTTPRDAKLPRGAVDLVLMVDVYHELPWPAETMAQVREALRPDGRVALVEYRAEDPEVAIKPEHKMTLEQITTELAAAGFRFERSDESLPEQRIVLFARAAP